MKYCFIINPASGKSDNKGELEASIKEKADALGVDVTVLFTEKAGDAKDYIVSFFEQNKDEELRFFACGGDGTLCEAVNGVMSLPERDRVSLGAVPVGTGNDFVRNFGGSEPFMDVAAQLEAEPFSIDLIKCNDFYAVNMVNIGFDCQVVVKTAQLKKKVPSKLAYIAGLIYTLIKKPGVSLKFGAQDTERDLLLCTFANGSFCGGGFNSNPHASLNDGKINALLVNNISRTRFIKLVGSYKKGTHLVPENEAILAESFSESYALAFDKSTNVSVDGEIFSVDSLNLSCKKDALRFLVPKGAAYIKKGTFEEVTV